MEKEKNDNIELTILMPCLNEERTVGKCIDNAMKYLDKSGIAGEVLIVDNGSTDNSEKIARDKGARVVYETEKGYGCAIRAGLKKAKGKYIIIGDCDLTYDFENLDKFVMAFYDRYAIIMGNRVNSSMEKGAMSLSHKLGVRFLSWFARIRFRTDIRDFHCGLRGITKEAADALGYECTGMEFATEFVAKAVRAGLPMTQFDITLYKGIEGRKPHLRTIPDGMRHLLYILRN